MRGTRGRERLLADLHLPRPLDVLLAPARIEQLRPAAVLIAVVDAAEPAVVLTRRSERLRHHPGQISLPGGAREAGDETLVATALREAREEVGLAPESVEVLGLLDDYPTSSRYRVTPVVGWVQGAFDPQLEKSEVAEVFHIPLDVVLDAGNYRRSSFFQRGQRWPFYELDYAGRRVWGATAGMLLNLCQDVARNGK